MGRCSVQVGRSQRSASSPRRAGPGISSSVAEDRANRILLSRGRIEAGNGEVGSTESREGDSGGSPPRCGHAGIRWVGAGRVDGAGGCLMRRGSLLVGQCSRPHSPTAPRAGEELRRRLAVGASAFKGCRISSFGLEAPDADRGRGSRREDAIQSSQWDTRSRREHMAASRFSPLAKEGEQGQRCRPEEHIVPSLRQRHRPTLRAAPPNVGDDSSSIASASLNKRWRSRRQLRLERGVRPASYKREEGGHRRSRSPSRPLAEGLESRAHGGGGLLRDRTGRRWRELPRAWRARSGPSPPGSPARSHNPPPSSRSAAPSGCRRPSKRRLRPRGWRRAHG